MDLTKYLKIFLSESQEHLQLMDDFLLRLERDPEDARAIDGLFRSAHSLKGMSTTMGFDEISKIANSLESFLEPFRREVRRLDRQAIDLLLQGVDLLRQSTAQVASEKSSQDSAGKGGEAAGPAGPPPLSVREGGAARREGMLRVDPVLLDDLIDLTSELLIAQEDLGNRERASEFQGLIRAVAQQATRLRMVPLQMVADRFPRMVRDVASQGGKEVVFEVRGNDVEMDRALLEGLSDPLVHLLRNAVDHGIEMPDERVRSGKPREGRVRLDAWKEKERVVIRVADDGKGINPNAIRETAVARGILSPEKAQTLPDTDLFRLLTLPGFSTKKEISEISGRGVGMDVVQSTVQSLQGILQMESVPGQGTSIILKLPLTLLRLPILLIQVSDEIYAFPVTQVRGTFDCPIENVGHADGREVFIRGENQIPLARLRSLLHLPELPPSSFGVLVEVNGREVGVMVDKIIAHREVVVKSFRSPLRRLKGLGGVTILEDGTVVLIVDLENLLL
ncbi:MAG: chemotaxis protein CheA [Candidatus Methylomirabilales bacterium]